MKMVQPAQSRGRPSSDSIALAELCWMREHPKCWKAIPIHAESVRSWTIRAAEVPGHARTRIRDSEQYDFIKSAEETAFALMGHEHISFTSTYLALDSRPPSTKHHQKISNFPLTQFRVLLCVDQEHENFSKSIERRRSCYLT